MKKIKRNYTFIYYYLLHKTRLHSNRKSLYYVFILSAFFAIFIYLQNVPADQNYDSNNNNNIQDRNEEKNRIFDKNDGDNDESHILGRFSGRNGEEKKILSNRIEKIEKRDNIIDKSPKSLFLSKNWNQSAGHSENLYPYSHMKIIDHWQSVSHARYKFYVFSAYFDDRIKPSRYVRIIAATKTRTTERVSCKFWYTHSYGPIIVRASNKLIRENWNLKYSAYFILCPLKDKQPVPDLVSVILDGRKTDDVDDDSKSMSNMLIVHNNRNKSKSRLIKQLRDEDKTGIAVCVKPMHYEYSKSINLIEFIELNRILGVSHFIFYNHSISKQVNCLLHQYISEGIVTVLPWKLDMISQKEIRTEGLFAAMNDCVYRTMNDFKYVLMIDFDEYIIPHSYDSLPQMLLNLEKINREQVGAYSFQNSFFYLQWPDDGMIANSVRWPLITLLKTRRKAQLNMHKQRSKCIILPDRVIEMGNHFVWEFAPRRMMANVNPNLGLLHHYRVCEFGGNECVNAKSVIDKRTHFWANALLKAVTQRMGNNLSIACNLNAN